jgi:hypothetical protein
LKLLKLGWINIPSECEQLTWRKEGGIRDGEIEREGVQLGSRDFDIFLEIQYASCVFALALKS